MNPKPAALSWMPRSALLSDIVMSLWLLLPPGESNAAAGIAVPTHATLPSTAADVRLGVSSADSAARKCR